MALSASARRMQKPIQIARNDHDNNFGRDNNRGHMDAFHVTATIARR